MTKCGLLFALAAAWISAGPRAEAAERRPEQSASRLHSVSVDGLWAAEEVDRAAGEPAGIAARGQALRLNAPALAGILREAPLEGADHTRSPLLHLPKPDGTFPAFVVEESPIVLPGTGTGTPPGVRTYRLRGVDDPTATGRLSWNGLRLHALVLADGGSFFIEPRTRAADALYASSDSDRARGPALRCSVETAPADTSVGAGDAARKSISAAAFSFGASLRVYRLAVAATAEYTARVSGNIADPTTAKQLAYDEIVATVNASNAVYERDLAMRLVLLTESDELSIIFTDSVADGYTSGDRDMMVVENQAKLDNVILPANYDIGIVFDDCSGGLSAGSVCTAGSKARLVAGGVCETLSFQYQTLYLIHEAGHQFTAPHTINYNDPTGQYVASGAYEIGSGSTIMSYAGCAPNICGNEGLQLFPDLYFHASTIAKIEEFVTNGGGTCNTVQSTGDLPPVLSAGADYTVPKQTPFALRAAATDADGDSLRYCWEEYDLGAINPPNDDADGQERPILRSYPPTPEPARVFPSLGYILDFANDPPEFYSGVDKDGNPRTYLVGESLPQISRTMTFRATVRDGKGGVVSDDMLLHVDGNSGPFAVTSPNIAVVWPAGSTQAVTWDVAGSTSAPVSCATVDILLSLDNGVTFPIVLVAGTANDGAEVVSVPADASSSLARVRVQAAGNVFFDISDRSFVVNQAPELTCPANISVENDPGECAAVVEFSPVVTDDQTEVTVSCVPASGSAFPKGTTHVLCTATDPHGASDTCGFDVMVDDAEGPTIQNLSATPTVLRPPNHKMRPVGLEVDVSDNCDDGASCHIASITSSEPVDGTGDGDTSPDWEITGALTANLRAERVGGGPGRIYTLTVECTDSAGNVSSRSTTVTVPHN